MWAVETNFVQMNALWQHYLPLWGLYYVALVPFWEFKWRFTRSPSHHISFTLTFPFLVTMAMLQTACKAVALHTLTDDWIHHIHCSRASDYIIILKWLPAMWVASNVAYMTTLLHSPVLKPTSTFLASISTALLIANTGSTFHTMLEGSYYGLMLLNTFATSFLVSWTELGQFRFNCGWLN